MKKNLYYYLFIFAFFNSILPVTILNVQETAEKKGLNIKLSHNFSFPSSQSLKEKFEKLLLNSPEKLVQENKKLEEQYGTNTSIITPEWFLQDSTSNPISLIGECGTSYCGLNRQTNPKNRLNFENQVVENISKKFNKNDKLVFTSFAFGTGFSELRILTKLIKLGFKNIHINLIDSAWHEYIEIIKTKNGNVQLDIFDESLPERGYWLRFHTYVLTQFIAWFNIPDLNFTFTIYPSSESYYLECKNNPNLKSDVIVSVDHYEGDMPWSFLGFLQVISGCLKSNGNAFELIYNPNNGKLSSNCYTKINEISEEILLNAFKKEEYKDFYEECEIPLAKFNKIALDKDFFKIENLNPSIWQKIRSKL